MQAPELPRGFLTLATRWKKAQLRRPARGPQLPAGSAPILREYRGAGNERAAGPPKAAEFWLVSSVTCALVTPDRDSFDGHVHRGPSERNLVTTRLKSSG